MSGLLAKMKHTLSERWQRMPAAERKRALLTSALLVFSAYAIFHAFVTMPATK